MLTASGRKLRPFCLLRPDIQINSDHKTKIIKLYSFKALNPYLNEKNLVSEQWQRFQNLVDRFLKRTLNLSEKLIFLETICRVISNNLLPGLEN